MVPGCAGPTDPKWVALEQIPAIKGNITGHRDIWTWVIHQLYTNWDIYIGIDILGLTGICNQLIVSNRICW